MNQFKDNSTNEIKKQAHLRVTMLASKRTLSEYSIILQRLIVGLTDESICSLLICPTEFDTDAIAPPGAEIIKYPFYEFPFTSHYNKKLLIEKLNKFNPTILHCLCEDKAPLARFLTKQLNIPYLLTINSLQKRFNPLSFSSKRLAKIIVPAESLIGNIAKYHPRLSDLITAIKAGTFASQTTECFNKTTKLASIITACPVKERIGFSNLLRTVRHLAIDGYEFMLIIISNQHIEKQLRATISALGLTQNVIIVPRLQPWRDLMAAADIFVQAWPSSSFNMMMLEAMSVGAAIASCKGGVDDLIIEGKTSYSFDATDELSIYNCLREMLDSRDKTRKLAKQAQQYVKQNHSVSKMITDTLQLYNDAVQWYKKT